MNSLFDTMLYCLQKNNKGIENIIWAGCTEYQIPLDNFFSIAKSTPDLDYNDYQEIPFDLIVVGNGFWIERSGLNETWVYKAYPKVSKRIVNVKKISSSDFTESDYEIIEMVKNKQNSLDTSYSQMWMLPYL